MQASHVASIWPAAKISAPLARALVMRERLLGPLNEATTTGRITLVVAPGGSGKTSLLAGWARQAPMPVAWYALDAADRDTRHLVSGILAAVERALPGTSDGAQRMLEHGVPEVAALGMLLSALEDRPLTLVVDDFQHLDAVQEATALWEHFFRFRPPALALVILSRSVPLLGFAALAAMDLLLGLGQKELSFDAAEAAELLAVHGLDPSTASRLAARSGGWATGVLLLARTGPEGVRQLRARHDALMAQLGSEMLASLPAYLREFLLESAALGPISPSDADEILGRRDSAALFAEIAARGLFLDQEEGLYRYHDLFAEHLVSTIQAESAGRLRAIRRGAAEWWEAHGNIPRALTLLAADEDWELLAALLDRTRGTLWTRRLWGTTISFIERLPPAFRSPRLLELCGHSYIERGEYKQALTLADAGIAAATNDEEWLRASLLSADALMRGGRYVECIRSAEAGLIVARRIGHGVAVTRMLECRGWARLRLGFFAEGREDLLTALETYKQAGNTEGEARTLMSLALQLTEAGQVADAELYLAKAGVLWRRAGNRIMLGNFHITRARLQVLHGSLAEAQADVNACLALLGEEAPPSMECTASATLAEICADGGDFGDAERHAGHAVDLAARLDDAHLFNAALRVRIAVALARRDRAGARQLIDEARTTAVTPVDNALLDLYEGMLALRSRALGRALERLGHATKQLEQIHRPQYAARAYLLLAEAALGSGRINRAEWALNRMAKLVHGLGCEDYLRPTARMARQVLGARRSLRGLRRRALLLLDGLAATVPALAVVGPRGDEDEGNASERLILHVSPFGRGRIALGDQRIDPAVLPRKARELLFFAVHAARPLSRNELLEALWDDDKRAAQNLWDASRHLRRVLGEWSWQPSRGLYSLWLTVHDDGHEFDQAASAALGKGSQSERLAAAEQALELVGDGGYLEWCDGLWAHAERARIMARATMVALALARIYEDLGRVQDAIRAGKRAVAFEPYEEAPRLALVRLLVADGQIEAALAEFDTYRALLRDDLQAEPSPRLRAEVARIASRG